MRSFLVGLMTAVSPAFAACPTPEVDAESLNEPAVVRVNEQTGEAEVSYDSEQTWTPVYSVAEDKLSQYEDQSNLHLAQYFNPYVAPYGDLPPGCPPAVVACPAFVVPRERFVYIAPPRHLPPPVDFYSRPRRLPPPVEIYRQPRVRVFRTEPYAVRRAAPFVYYRYGRRW